LPRNRKRWSRGVKYGFIGAEGAPEYTGKLAQLPVGGRVWVMAGQPNGGYVGVGRIIGPPVPAAEFSVDDGHGGRLPVMSLAGWEGTDTHADGPGVFVPVAWEESQYPGTWEHGFFANQHLVSQPKADKWPRTVERLAELWGVEL